MGHSQHLLAVDRGETNPVIPLSAEDFLCALARTPHPRRFDRRRQRLLDGKSRMSRVRSFSKDVGHSTTVEAGPSKLDPAPIDAMTKSQPPLNAEYCHEPSVNGPDSLTLEKVTCEAQFALLSPTIDVGHRGEAGDIADGNNLFVEFRPFYGKQRCMDNDEESSMFVRADSINEDENSNEFKRTSLHYRHETESSPEFPVRSEYRKQQCPSSGLNDDAVGGERGCIETLILDKTEDVSAQSNQNLHPLPKNKLRRPSRKNFAKIIAYGRRNPTEAQQPTRETHMIRRLAVDEMDLVLDGVLSNQAYNPDAEMTGSDDDTILDFSSSPCKGLGRPRIRHQAGHVVNKRKPLGELTQNVFKPEGTDLIKYKLPNDYGMSPKTKKRLKTSTTCSDGFEGSESQPTGRTIPMRLPRRYPRAPKQKSARVTELTLRSSRGISVNTENSQVLQRESIHSDAIIRVRYDENDTMTDAFHPLIRQVQEFIGDENRTYRPIRCSRLENLSPVPLPFKGGNIHPETATAETTLLSTNRPKRRVTFSDEVKNGMTNVDDDGSCSESPDEDWGDDHDERKNDNHHDSEGGNSNAEIDAKEEGVQLSVSSLGATHQRQQTTEEDPWRPRKPVSTHRLIEVDDDILDYPSYTTELSGDGDESGSFYPAGAGRWELQSVDSNHPSRNQDASKRMEGLLIRKQSQASIELGDPNWSVPYGSEDEMSYSQTQNSDYSSTDFHGHVVEEHPKYLNQVLGSFSGPSQGNFNLIRSRSMPSSYRFHSVNPHIQEDRLVVNLEVSPALEHTVSPPNQSLSQMQSIDLRALTRVMGTEVGTIPVRGQVQPLSFNPPFLRD